VAVVTFHAIEHWLFGTLVWFTLNFYYHIILYVTLAWRGLHNSMEPFTSTAGILSQSVKGVGF